MSSGIQIRVQGTEEQFGQMTGQCELTEQLFAQTLARRIEGMKAEESIEFILSWFQSVRHMAQAALMSSGIKTSVVPIGSEPQPGQDEAIGALREATRLMDAKGVAPGKFLERLGRICAPQTLIVYKSELSREAAGQAAYTTRGAEVTALVGALNQFIHESWKVTPNSAQLDQIRRIICETDGT